mmetsp:Transcript_42654/g.102853  ORF Transcript_42654/g.102853 Transcript_42654/m.102853 type:complete len:919 (+) Transcript_42654:101-2857(+)
MVEIRRSRLGNNKIQNPFAGGSSTNGSGGGSSSRLATVFRLIIIAIIGILGFRIFLKPSSSSTSGNGNTHPTSLDERGKPHPMGLDERLQHSKQQQQQQSQAGQGHLRKQQQPIIKPPPPQPGADLDSSARNTDDDKNIDKGEEEGKKKGDDATNNGTDDHANDNNTNNSGDKEDDEGGENEKEKADEEDNNSDNSEDNTDDEKQKKEDSKEDEEDGAEDKNKEEVVQHDDVEQQQKGDGAGEENDDRVAEENEKIGETKTTSQKKANKAPPTSGAEKNPIVVEKKGTGPTNVGYVKDFIHERANPAHRGHRVELMDLTNEVAKLVDETGEIVPCETLVGDYLTASMETNPKCLDQDTPLIAYNPERFPRTWCGHNIDPGAAITLDEHCTDKTVHHFSSIAEADVPPVSGDHMPPILIKSKKETKGDDLQFESVKCNIPCEIEKDMEIGAGDVYIDEEESWTITQTMKDGYYDLSAKIERIDFMKDHYYSTQSFKSDVPLTYYDFNKYNLHDRVAVDFDATKPSAIYLADSNCAASATRRSKYYGAMKSKVTVDSYGSCSHSKDPPDGISLDKLDDRIKLMREYRIVLAFDTASSKDHISPMIWEALISGSVPVVVGSDNIREHLPRKSYISKTGFSNWDDLAEYVGKVIDDKELWESYQTWREDDDAISAVEAKYEFSKTSPTCRLCRWAYAKKYGLGWNNTAQQVRDIIKVPKEKFCTSANHGLVHLPFSEEWILKGGEERSSVLSDDSGGESCSRLYARSNIDVGSFSSHREVVYHDGVADFTLSDIKNESSDSSGALRLSFPGIRNPDGAAFLDTHTTISTAKGSLVSSATVQDDLVKVTVLADWNANIVGAGEGVLEVTINADSSDRKRRIRVIIEEMNAVHDKLTEFYPSSFYKRMAKDFIDPLPIFFANSE